VASADCSEGVAVVLKIGELVEDDATVVSDVGSVYIFMARHLRGWQPRHVLFSDGQQTLADASAAERYPGIAAHRQACGPCGEDFDGLLAAMRGAAGFFDGADGAGVLSVTPHDHQDPARRPDGGPTRPRPGSCSRSGGRSGTPVCSPSRSIRWRMGSAKAAVLAASWIGVGSS
jgi:hypothetical protein